MEFTETEESPAQGWGGEIVQIGPNLWRVWGREYYTLSAARHGRVAHAPRGKSKKKRVPPRGLNTSHQ